MLKKTYIFFYLVRADPGNLVLIGALTFVRLKHLVSAVDPDSNYSVFSYFMDLDPYSEYGTASSQLSMGIG